MIPFHRQLADLGVKSGGLALAFLGGLVQTDRPAREKARDIVLYQLLPAINLVWMHPVALGQLGNRRLLAQRLKRDLRLKRRIELLACLAHPHASGSRRQIDIR